MSLLKVIDADDDVICYLDISETFCPDDELEGVIRKAMEMDGEYEEYLEEWGIYNVYFDNEKTIKIV